MNKSKIFTIFDQKAGAFLQPFFLPTNATAVRAISDCVNDPDHSFHKHSEDYTLYELGLFNDDDASFEMLDSPLTICLLQTLKEN